MPASHVVSTVFTGRCLPTAPAGAALFGTSRLSALLHVLTRGRPAPEIAAIQSLELQGVTRIS